MEGGFANFFANFADFFSARPLKAPPNAPSGPVCGRTQRRRRAKKERQSRRAQADLPQRSPGARPEQHEQAPLSGGVYDREPERGRKHQHAEQRVARRLPRPARAEHAPRRAEHIIRAARNTS